MPVHRPEIITDPLSYHGEGVIWDAGAGLVRWVDMLAGDVLSMDPAKGGVQRHHVSAIAAAIRPRSVGGFVVAIERGFALLDASLLSVRKLRPLWLDTTVRMNDGGCDPAGRFFCGSMAADGTPSRGKLFRLDVDGTATVILDRVTISNGIAWSPDGGTAYYVDSTTRRLDAFDYDPVHGSLNHRRPIATIDEHQGTPDGITVDSEGFIWVAMWGGSAVRRYRLDGRLDGLVELPVKLVTSCAFGGPFLDELYITTSRLGLGEAAEASAGALYSLKAGVQGLPPHTFGG